MKFYYCIDCLNICNNDKSCANCGGNHMNLLKEKMPLKVIATKEKVKFSRAHGDKIVTSSTANNDKTISEYSPNEIMKIL